MSTATFRQPDMQAVAFAAAAAAVYSPFAAAAMLSGIAAAANGGYHQHAPLTPPSSSRSYRPASPGSYYPLSLQPPLPPVSSSSSFYAGLKSPSPSGMYEPPSVAGLLRRASPSPYCTSASGVPGLPPSLRSSPQPPMPPLMPFTVPPGYPTGVDDQHLRAAAAAGFAAAAAAVAAASGGSIGASTASGC